MARACVFVDGENFRYTLAHLFPENLYPGSRERYLPDADWHAFFSWITLECGAELLRAYWYVTSNLDFRPYKVPHNWNEKERLFRNCEQFAERLAATANDVHRKEVLKSIEATLTRRRRAIEERWSGQRQMLFSIERCNDRIEVRRSGSITFDLFANRFGTEKGVDTQLATDLIVLADNYEVAIVVSGDADYLPPITAIKGRGKLVYSVCFLDSGGDKLPGGARRLEAVVDSTYEVPFREALSRLCIAERAGTSRTPQRKVNSQ